MDKNAHVLYSKYEALGYYLLWGKNTRYKNIWKYDLKAYLFDPPIFESEKFTVKCY